MSIAFLLCVAFCLYTYAGFPLWLHWRARRRTSAGIAVESSSLDCSAYTAHDLARLPRVSVVIAVHNESENLPVKVQSLDALDYPADRLEVLFVSDGSTDDSLNFLQRECGQRSQWQVLHYAPAAGKPTALNLGVSRACGDILLFMDARQPVASNALALLVHTLQDESVGAASGELVLAADAGQDAAKVSLYWRYEKWIRQSESTLFSTTGATGALYAIRRVDYAPLPADTLLDDFDIPIRLLRRGKRTVFVSGAVVFDQAEADASREFRRKVRTLSGNFQSFVRHPWLFDPLRNPVWWQFLSHKVFRLLVPYVMVLAFITSVIGDSHFLRLMLLLQLVFYGLGLAGYLGIRNRLTTLIRVFLQLNVAAVLGAWQAMSGRARVKWKVS